MDHWPPFLNMDSAEAANTGITDEPQQRRSLGLEFEGGYDDAGNTAGLFPDLIDLDLDMSLFPELQDQPFFFDDGQLQLPTGNEFGLVQRLPSTPIPEGSWISEFENLGLAAESSQAGNQMSMSGLPASAPFVLNQLGQPLDPWTASAETTHLNVQSSW